jgi:ABC-2 type transport system permease protein
MNKILAIFFKDTRLRFSSPMEWGFFLILPIIFILILGRTTGAQGDRLITLYTVDQANTPLSTSLIKELERSSAVIPYPSTLEEALNKFEARELSAVLIIPADFSIETMQAGEASVELRQQPNNTVALVDQQAVAAALNRISSVVDIANLSTEKAEIIKPFATAAERQAYFDQALTKAQDELNNSPDRVREMEATTADAIPYDPATNSVAGQMITWVFIPLIGLSASFAFERQIGTLRRILTTPTSKALYIGGTVFTQVILAALQMTILILFGALVLKVNWGTSPLALAMIIFSSTLAAAALGTMLGTFIKTEAQGNGVSIMIGMVMAMLGGCWYPLELFPQVMQTAAKVLPTTWAMQGLLDISLRGQGVSGVWPETVVLLGFAVLFFGIGVWRFRYE